jgi:hypothetical protein
MRPSAIDSSFHRNKFIHLFTLRVPAGFVKTIVIDLLRDFLKPFRSPPCPGVVNHFDGPASKEGRRKRHQKVDPMKKAALALAFAGIFLFMAPSSGSAGHRHPRYHVGVGIGVPGPYGYGPPVWAARPWWGYPVVGAAPPVYYGPPPLIVPPPVYAPPSAEVETGFWYYCEGARAYYPYVRSCPGGWMRVVPETVPPDYR